MKQLKELMNQTFIMRCVCGSSRSQTPSFSVCTTPFYNETLNAVFCEKCNNPVFISVVDPLTMEKDPEIHNAMLNNYFTLHSDQAFLDGIAKMREKFQAEEPIETIPLKGLTLLDIMGIDEET